MAAFLCFSCQRVKREMRQCLKENIVLGNISSAQYIFGKAKVVSMSTNIGYGLAQEGKDKMFRNFGNDVKRCRKK